MENNNRKRTTVHRPVVKNRAQHIQMDGLVVIGEYLQEIVGITASNRSEVGEAGRDSPALDW